LLGKYFFKSHKNISFSKGAFKSLCFIKYCKTSHYFNLTDLGWIRIQRRIRIRNVWERIPGSRSRSMPKSHGSGTPPSTHPVPKPHNWTFTPRGLLNFPGSMTLLNSFLAGSQTSRKSIKISSTAYTLRDSMQTLFLPRNFFVS
jgi:hypothetical protein